MAKQVKIGIIGVGNMGHSHVYNVHELPNTCLTAVCDTDQAKLDRIKPEVKAQIKMFTNSKDFFEQADIDAVIIAVPHYDHVPLAIEALRRGKHIIVEKPIAVDKQSGMELLAEAEKYPDLVKSVMLCQRTLPNHAKIKKIIDNGELGAIKRVNWIVTDWYRTQFYYDSGDWRASWRGEGGGVLINQCPHQLDMLQWFCGMPDQVVASVNNFTLKHAIEVEDTASALYSGKANFTFFATNGSHRDFMPEVMLYTKDGYIRIMGDYVLENDELKYFNSTQKVYGKGCYGTGHGRLFAHFYDCVKKGEKFPINGEEGSKVIKMILATYESNGEKIDV